MIIDALNDALASAKCDHQFHDFTPSQRACGISARCRKCSSRFTAWPGSIHYDQIKAAMDAKTK